MKALRTLLSLAALPSTLVLLAGQDPVTVSWQAGSALRLETGEQPSHVRDTWTIPVGTDLLVGVHGRAGALGDGGEAQLDARYLPLGQHAFRVELEELVLAEESTWPFDRDGYARAGLHETRIRLVPRHAHPVRLRIERMSDVVRSGGRWASWCEVDVGADGVPDLSLGAGQDAARSFDVVLPVGGLEVVTRTESWVEAEVGEVELRELLAVELLPVPSARFETYGIAVGLGIDGSEVLADSSRRLQVDTVGPALAYGAESFGFQRLALPIPGTLCTLRNENFLSLPFVYDPQGHARLVHLVPAELLFELQIQVFAVHPTVHQLMCSEGLEVVVAYR